MCTLLSVCSIFSLAVHKKKGFGPFSFNTGMQHGVAGSSVAVGIPVLKGET
jgi:hypothetical protein